MIELLPGLPRHVAAYKATGSVSEEEYDHIVVARVNEVADQFGKINFMVILETDMDNYSIGAFLIYVRVSFRHFFRWERMAIVTDQSWLRDVYDLLRYVLHGWIKTYPLSDIDKARRWVSGPIST